MAFRKALSRSQSRGNFHRGEREHPRNKRMPLMRGGIRL